MTADVATTWAFGGPLLALGPALAWSVLLLVAAIGLALAWLGSGRTIPVLPAAKRCALLGVRAAFLLALLLCLADPVRIAHFTIHAPPPPPPVPRQLAVLIDRSDSMTRADNRGRTRLDDAVAAWRRLEPAARAAFAALHYFSFAGDLRPADTLDQALQRTGQTDRTNLLPAVLSLLRAPPADRPAALVLLTDGLDNSGTDPAAVRAAALAAQIPLYFVPGSNRTDPEPFLRVREWRVPALVLRQTDFTVDLSFEAFSLEERAVPFSLWEGDRRVAGGVLPLALGSNLIPRSFRLNSGETGTRDYALRFGDLPSDPVVARSVTFVQPRHPVRILFFQGAFDWGFRLFVDSLRTDPDFTPTAVFAHSAPAAIAPAADSSAAGLAALPNQPDGYRDYDCVVLSRLFPQQLSAAQQSALIEFVRWGGSVLFTNLDPASSPQFARSPLAELFPVDFSPRDLFSATAEQLVPHTEDLSRFGVDLDESRETTPPDQRILQPVELTAAGRASPIFSVAGGGALLPRFAQFAAVSVAKPGAEVLAIHPSARNPQTGQPYILFARQAFGRGHTAFLATDGLWRWKLSEPSASHAVETFWQQLLLTLGRSAQSSPLRFLDLPAQVQPEQTVSLRLAGNAGDLLPAILATAPSGAVFHLEVHPEAAGEAPWSAEWKPGESGLWKLSASIAGELPAYTFPSVTPEATGELARTPTDVGALRDWAAATGGALLTGEPPLAWRPPARDAAPSPVGHDDRSLRWDTWPVLVFALGLYAVELILRRRWQLV